MSIHAANLLIARSGAATVMSALETAESAVPSVAAL